VDVDAAWASIVAGFDDEVDEPARPSLDEPRRAPRFPVLPVEDQPSLLDALDTFGADLPDEETDEGYTPPPPPPLPRPSRAAVFGIGAMLAGLVLFLVPELLPVDNDTALLVALGLLLSGFVTLVWRLRRGDDEVEDPDDGAVI